MKTKISDFKIAEYLVRNLCKRRGTKFVDLEVDFGARQGFADGKIGVKDEGRLSKTLFQIVSFYLQGMESFGDAPDSMTNEEKGAYIAYAASVLRELSYAKDGFPEAFTDHAHALRANRQPLVWIALRDIICPAIDVPLKNVEVISAKSGRIDAAKYVDNGGSRFVFLNGEVENQGVRSAYLIRSILDAIGVDSKSALNTVMSHEEVWNKLSGLAKAALVDTGLVNDFSMTLAILSEYANVNGVLEQEKTAKWNKRGLWSQSQAGNLWWQLGLIEQMLDADRGPDWSGYFITKPFLDDFAKRVEEEKERRGLKELSTELLLRVQSEEFKQRPDLIIQGLLADNRVW